MTCRCHRTAASWCWRRRVGCGCAILTHDWRHLPGTAGASTPFWSPDSRYVGFIVNETLLRLDTTGGPPETVATIPTAAPRSGTWNRQGDIVLGSWGGGAGGPLWRVSAAGGAATAFTQVDLARGEFVHTWPTFLPDGKHFLYFRSGPPDVEGMYVGSLDVGAGNQSPQRILATGVPAVFASGHLFFPRAGTLMAQPFDARRLELRDVPVPVAQDVGITWYSTGVFSVSDAGVFVYRTESASDTFQLTWLDRQGKTAGTVGPPGTDRRVVLSPDGRRAVARDAPYNVPGDLWILDLASGRRSRFTFKGDVYSDPVWSPDGARIAYAAGRLGDTIYEKAASGLGEEQMLLKEPGCGIFRPVGRATVGSCFITPRTLRTRDMTCGHCRSATASPTRCWARFSMSGLASSLPICVGLPTYLSRAARLRSTYAPSERQDRAASRHSARASGRSRRAIGHSGASTERSSSTTLLLAPIFFPCP